MRHKNLVEKDRSDMKDNGQQNISVGSVIDPVHQNDKRDHTQEEIQRVYPLRSYQIAVIIAFDGRERKMPESPEKGKKKGSFQ
jgi:hypothetical protein